MPPACQLAAGRVGYGDQYRSASLWLVPRRVRSVHFSSSPLGSPAGCCGSTCPDRSGLSLHLRANVDPWPAPTPFFAAVATRRSDPVAGQIIPLFQLYTPLLNGLGPAIQHLADAFQAAVPQLRRLHRRATPSIFFRGPLVPPLHHPFCFNGIGLHGAVLGAVLIEVRRFRSLVHLLYFGRLFRRRDADAALPTLTA